MTVVDLELEMQINARLQAAQEFMFSTQRFILELYGSQSLKVELKKDRSQVTLADQQTELNLRKWILERFPSDAVLGEEYGEHAGNSGFRWILDPIDGTQSFVSGVPFFGTLIGIEAHHNPVAGLVGFPALNEVFLGVVGKDSYLTDYSGSGRQPIRVSSLQDPKEALVLFTSPQVFELAKQPHLFQKLQCEFERMRGWGDCFGHMMVARGRAEVMFDPIMNLWDVAALYPILLGAGGDLVDLKGKSTIYGGSAISFCPNFRHQIMNVLGSL